MKEIRAGVVGLGGFFRSVHLPCMNRVPGLRIVAGCDVSDAARASAGQLLGDIRLFSSVADMLSAGGLDAVYVITKPGAMPEVVAGAASAGLPIFCEKPPGLRSQDARAMAEMCERTGVPHQVAFNRRFSPLTRKLKDWLAEIGPATRIETVFRRVFSAAPTAVAGSGIHAIDQTINLIGPVRRVMGARAAQRAGQGFCHFHAAFEFASGACGAFLYDNRCQTPIELYRLSVVSQDTLDICQLDLHFPPPTNVRQPSRLERTRLLYRDWGPSGAVFDTERDEFALPAEQTADLLVVGGYLAEHEEFVACLRSGRPMSPTFAETVHSMEVAEAIQAGAFREFR